MRAVACVIAVTALFAAAVSGAALTYPAVLSSTAATWSAALDVQATRWTEPSQGYVSMTTRLYCSQGVCTLPGPTIRLKPGDTFTLTLTNSLGAETSSTHTMNTMHSPNTTNVHTHGLHVDPNIDSVFVSAAPGGSHTYVYQIPASHAPGLHWYHSHLHGSSTLQVMGGLFGAIYVEPTAAANLPLSYTSKTAHVMVLSHLKINPSLAGGNVSQGCGFSDHCDVATQPGCLPGTAPSPFAPFRHYDMQELTLGTGSALMPNPTFGNANNVQDMYFVNGQYQPSLTMAPGEGRILQLLHTAGDSVLQVRAPTQGGPTGTPLCTLKLLAQDGVFRRTAKDVSTGFKLTNAGRAEVSVTCATAGTYTFTGQFGDNTQYTQTLFTITVTGTATTSSSVTDAELAAIVRPAYLSDLTNAEVLVDNTYAVHFSQGGRQLSTCGFWLGAGTNCYGVWHDGVNPSADSPVCPFEQFPGAQGGDGTNGAGKYPSTARYKFVTKKGAVNEWKIYGLGTDAHTLHIHVNHFQIVGYTPISASGGIDYTEYFTIGEWYDTVPAFDAEMVIRFVAADFVGETVLHCHFLRHEDLGMMSSFYVCDGTDGSCPTPTLTRNATTNSAPSRVGAASGGVGAAVFALAAGLAALVLARANADA